jgi:hypothetical protein
MLSMQSEDSESSFNSWFGMNVKNDIGIQPTNYAFIPIFTNSIGTGYELPFLSGITNSGIAFLTNIISVSYFRIILFSLSLLYLNYVFSNFIKFRDEKPIFLLLSLYFNLGIFPIIYSYTIKNDWWDIGIGFCAGSAVLINILNGIRSIEDRNQRINKLKHIYLLQFVGFFLLSLTHLGYIGAIILPIIYIFITITIVQKNSSRFYRFMFVNFLIFIFSISNNLIETYFALRSKVFLNDVEDEQISSLMQKIVVDNFSFLLRDYNGREIFLNLGASLGLIILNFYNRSKRLKSNEANRNKNIQNILVYLPFISMIFVLFNSKINYLINPSINYLFRDMSVLATLIAIILQVKSREIRFSYKYNILIVISIIVLQLVWFKNTVQSSSDFNNIKKIFTAEKSERGVKFLRKYSEEMNQITIWSDEVFWRNEGRFPDAPQDNEELRESGIYSIGGWPKIRNIQSLDSIFQGQLNLEENYIGANSCDVILNSFLMVDYIVRHKMNPCSKLNQEFVTENFIWYKVDRGLPLRISGMSGYDVNCTNEQSIPSCFKDSGIMKQDIKYSNLVIEKCKSNCVFRIRNLTLQSNEAILLPVGFNKYLKLKSGDNVLQQIEEIKFQDFKKFGAIRNSSNTKIFVKNLELIYSPSNLKIFQIYLQYIYILALFISLANYIRSKEV